MSEPVAAVIAAAIVLSVLVVWTQTGDRPDIACADRDMPAAERMFASCITARSGRNGAARECRREAETLSCKSWSRP